MNHRSASVAAVAIFLGLIGVGLSEFGMAVIKPASLSVLDSYVRENRRAPFPRRPAGALGGRALMERTAGWTAARRERALVAEIVSGNVPDQLRILMPVRVAAMDLQGRNISGTVWVLPDYLAVGSNDDYVRVPLSLEAASRIALHFGMALPTTKMVDAVYASADLKLTPQPLPPTREMTSNNYTLRHNGMIEQDIQSRMARNPLYPQLVAGHKKDVVMTSRLAKRSDRVAIFGWHRGVGRPIQPLSTVHDRMYADYSHGVRLISGTVFADGRDVQIEEALADRAMARLLTYEGQFSGYAAILETAAHMGSKSTRFFAALTH